MKVDFRGDSIPIQLEDLGSPDIPDSSYKLEGNWVTRSGYSLRAVLEAAARSAGFQMISVVSVEIDAKPGTRTIARSQLDNGPPIFFGEDGGTSWILPGSGGGDAQLFAFKDSVPVIRVNYGLEFRVELSAAPPKVHAGDEVQLKARVTGQQPGEKLTYDWDFGDGKVVEGASGKVSHRFAARGSYEVDLEVTAPNGGGLAHTTVQVGKAKKPEKEKEDPGDGKKKDDGKDGKRRGNGGGEGTGGGSGSGTGNGAGTGTGSGTGTVNGTGDGSEAGYGPTGTTPENSSSEPAPKQRERPRSRRTTPAQDDQQLVRGFLIDPADFTQGPAPAQADEQPRSGGTDKGGSGVGRAALSFTGVLILLALGGSTERLLFRRA